MSNEYQNLSKLLHFTDSLCAFADNAAENYDCRFNVEIGDDKFKFDLPELVAEIRKYRQAVIDDIENLSNGEQDDTKSIFDEPFVPEFTTKTSNDEITMSDFDDVRKDMSGSVKKMFDLLLPLSIIEEENEHKKLSEPKPKSVRVKAIEMYTMLRMAQITVS